MDERIARNVLRRTTEAMEKSVASVNERIICAVEKLALARLAAGRRLRPEDEKVLGAALAAAVEGEHCLVATWHRRHAGRTAFDILLAEPHDVEIVDTKSEGTPSVYREPVVALRAIAIEWDRRRLMFATMPAYIEIAEHLRLRFIQRLGGGDEVARRLGSALGVMAATCAAARRDDPKAKHWPVFAPTPEGMIFGSGHILPVKDTGERVRRVFDHRGVTDLDEIPRGAFGAQCFGRHAGETCALYHALRTFVDVDAMREAQTALHAKLQAAADKHADAALSEFRRGFVDFDPADESDAGAHALYADVAAALATPEGRQAQADARRAWETSQRGRLVTLERL